MISLAVLTSYIDNAAQEPFEGALAHVTVHNLVELLYPAEPPSRQVAPESFGVLQALLVDGAMLVRHGFELQWIAHGALHVRLR